MGKIIQQDYKFSVLMPLAVDESDTDLLSAMNSITNQTLMPDEILIMVYKTTFQCLKNTLEKYKSKFPEILNIVILDEPVNQGKALREGVNLAKNPIIAVMNAKNIAKNTRFEKQIAFLKEHTDIDIVGSWTEEFDGTPDKIYAIREVPTEHNDIYHFSKFRNPINHTTAVYKKDSILKAANYLCRKKMADYELWVSMLYQGCKFANIPECLVSVRAGKDYIKKITGQNKVFLYEYGMFEDFLNSGFIGIKDFFKAVSFRFFFRMLPDWLRLIIHNNFLCRKIKE